MLGLGLVARVDEPYFKVNQESRITDSAEANR